MDRANYVPSMRAAIGAAAITLLAGLWLDAVSGAAHANRRRFDPHPYGQHSKSQHRAYRYDQEYYGFREQPAPSPHVIRPQIAPPPKKLADPPLRAK